MPRSLDHALALGGAEATVDRVLARVFWLQDAPESVGRLATVTALRRPSSGS